MSKFKEFLERTAAAPNPARGTHYRPTLINRWPIGMHQSPLSQFGLSGPRSASDVIGWGNTQDAVGMESLRKVAEFINSIIGEQQMGWSKSQDGSLDKQSYKNKYPNIQWNGKEPGQGGMITGLIRSELQTVQARSGWQFTPEQIEYLEDPKNGRIMTSYHTLYGEEIALNMDALYQALLKYTTTDQPIKRGAAQLADFGASAIAQRTGQGLIPSNQF